MQNECSQSFIIQGSPHGRPREIKTKSMGMVWAEFMTTSIDFLPVKPTMHRDIGGTKETWGEHWILYTQFSINPPPMVSTGIHVPTCTLYLQCLSYVWQFLHESSSGVSQ